MSAVSPFDLQRYQGHWYELARLDHSFERGLTDVSATYTPQPDGSVRVVSKKVSLDVLKAAGTPDGGEELPKEW